MDNYITAAAVKRLREAKGLTQAQLAEQIGVSSKAVSKWETAKCMPDYTVITKLCEELNITISELMDGEESDGKSVRVYDDEQILDLLRRTQELEKQKNALNEKQIALDAKEAELQAKEQEIPIPFLPQQLVARR